MNGTSKCGNLYLSMHFKISRMNVHNKENIKIIKWLYVCNEVFPLNS
jgi:hypothetical protein